jgi:hypothetical protein
VSARHRHSREVFQVRFVLALLILSVASSAAAVQVIFVDNRVPPPGDGTHERPLATLAQAERFAGFGAIIYVAETDKPYLEGITLKQGQKLIGSAFGLDALRTEMHIELDAPPVPAQQGPGPSIRGTILVAGDNLIAGFTLLSDGATSIASAGATGPLTVKNVYFKTSNLGYGIFLQDHHGAVMVSGGALEATGQGGGIGVTQGDGDVVFDRFPLSGEFSTAVLISNRIRGAVTFRRGSKIRVRDATGDAITIANVQRPSAVVFEDVVHVQGRRRGLVAKNVAKLALSAGGSAISTTNAAALEVRDSGVELSFESVSAEGIAPGVLEEGIILNRVHGHVAITGVEEKPGTGGTIRQARGLAVEIVQTDNVHLCNMLLADSGTNKPIKGIRCAGNFDASSTAVCHAALYLGHVTTSSFDHLVIDGGGAMGINANNIRDVTFTGVSVHHAGDETFESGVLLQELGGTVTFNVCTLTDNAGSEMLVEQRYNSGRLVLDRCNLTTPERPEVAANLLDAHTFGASKLEVEIRNSVMRDNLRAAIEALAAETSTLSIVVTDSTLQHFGSGIITAEARQAGQLAMIVHGTTFTALAVREKAWLEVSAGSSPSDVAGACVDLGGNRFTGAEGTAIRLHAFPKSVMRVTGAVAPVDVNSVRGVIEAGNGGAQTVVDAAPASLAAVAACR